MRHRQDTGRDRCRRAARGTPRRVFELPGIVTGAVEPRLGVWVQAELRARATAYENDASLFATRDIGGLVVSNKIFEQAAAKGRRLTGLEEAKVLDKVQRPFGEACRNRSARLLVLRVHDGIDCGIDLFRPSDRSLQHLLGAALALGDESGEGGSVVLPIFFELHGLQISTLRPMENEDSYITRQARRWPTPSPAAPHAAERTVVDP